MGAEFFHIQTVQEALEQLFSECALVPRTAVCETVQAIGRVLTRPIVSPIDLPAFPRSSMDGYAVRAADTYGASQALPAYLTCVASVPMGSVPQVELRSGEAAEIFTGAMLPRGADAVVMIEKTQKIDQSQIEILAPAAPGENVVGVGEDIRQGAALLSAGCRLRPQDLGGLLAVGILSVEVAAPPRVAILSCGDELVAPDDLPPLGKIRDINAQTLAALFQEAGAVVTLLGIAVDQFDDLFDRAYTGLQSADLLVITAGSSVSARDLTREVIARLGPPGIVQHGLAIKPGKPTILAVCDGKPVIGLPGNPVSAFLVARQIVIPIIQRLLGEKPRPAASLTAVLSSNIPSAAGREDTVPVRLVANDQGWIAEPIFGKSNLIFTLIHADGVVQVPLNSGGLKAGTSVQVTLF